MEFKKGVIGIGCGAIIINDKSEVLLVKKSFSSIGGSESWTRPGGEVKFGNTIEESLKEHVKNETGFEVEIVRFLDMNEIIDDEKGVHWLALGYLCKPIFQEQGFDVSGEVRWFSISDLPKDLTEHTRSSLESYFTLN